MGYHNTEPGYDASEHCPRCGSFATRVDETDTDPPVRWRCQRDDCGFFFVRYYGSQPRHPSSPETRLGSSTDETADGPPECQNCGTVVSRDYARVFGNEDDVLEHCWACASRMTRYSNDPVIEHD